MAGREGGRERRRPRGNGWEEEGKKEEGHSLVAGNSEPHTIPSGRYDPTHLLHELLPLHRVRGKEHALEEVVPEKVQRRHLREVPAEAVEDVPLQLLNVLWRVRVARVLGELGDGRYKLFGLLILRGEEDAADGRGLKLRGAGEQEAGAGEVFLGRGIGVEGEKNRRV